MKVQVYSTLHSLGSRRHVLVHIHTYMYTRNCVTIFGWEHNVQMHIIIIVYTFMYIRYYHHLGWDKYNIIQSTYFMP